MVIVRNVTASCEEAKIVAAGKAIEMDLKDLLECVGYTSRQAYSSCQTTQLFRTLKTIVSDLTKIQDQNRLLVVIFSNLNKDKLDGCMDRLAVALERFQVIFPTQPLMHDLPFT